MRASVLVLGPLLALLACESLAPWRLRHRHASDRPASEALEAMGAEIDLQDGLFMPK